MKSFNIKTNQDAYNAIIKMLSHKESIIIRTADEIIKLVEAVVNEHTDTLWHTIEVQNLTTGVISRDDLTDDELQSQLFKSKGICIQF